MRRALLRRWTGSNQTFNDHSRGEKEWIDHYLPIQLVHKLVCLLHSVLFEVAIRPIFISVGALGYRVAECWLRLAQEQHLRICAVSKTSPIVARLPIVSERVLLFATWGLAALSSTVQRVGSGWHLAMRT